MTEGRNGWKPVTRIDGKLVFRNTLPERTDQPDFAIEEDHSLLREPTESELTQIKEQYGQEA